ncbi:unnamed protein product, partial [Pylaiella littoralis]
FQNTSKVLDALEASMKVNIEAELAGVCSSTNRLKDMCSNTVALLGPGARSGQITQRVGGSETSKTLSSRAGGGAATDAGADGIDSSVLVPALSHQALTVVTTGAGATAAGGDDDGHREETPDRDVHTVSGEIRLLETTGNPAGAVNEGHGKYPEVVQELRSDASANGSVDAETPGPLTGADAAATPPCAMADGGGGGPKP